MKFHLSLSILLLAAGSLFAADVSHSPFPIRGTMPWHNFLSGPSAWNEVDYRQYLDHMQSLGLNYIAFHCYTGGLERYAPYVEPIIRMRFRDVIPEATFDTSLTARWGYRPLAVSQFAFDTGKLFKLPPGVDAFGADCMTLARTNQERYDRAQTLMRHVIQMAHQRGIQVGIGFEYGIYPPEFLSIVPPHGFEIPGTSLPDPTNASSIEILHNTLDDLLAAYPDLDWIWLWEHEHAIYAGHAQPEGKFAELMKTDRHFFSDAPNELAVFNGVWSLAYIREAQRYLAEKAPKVHLVISGWGGPDQLSAILRGLDRALPQNIVFSCLNPAMGAAPQLAILGDIAKHRDVWAIPWLEGDYSLWHLQLRASSIRQQIELAAQQHLKGVLAVHWRTEETRSNLNMFATAAADPGHAPGMEDFYLRDCQQQFGPAADIVAPILARADQEQTLRAASEEYFPYDPTTTGRLPPDRRKRIQEDLEQIRAAALKTKDAGYRSNLNWLADNFEFALLLDEVSKDMEPAYHLKEQWLTQTAGGNPLKSAAISARADFNKAPIEAMFRTFARRVRSRGELGELSSLNQRVWLEYQELDVLLKNLGGP